MDPITFANNVFSSDIKTPHSIQLESEDMDTGDLFEFLLIVFTNGLKIYYGDSEGKVDISTITVEQFKKINKYYHSFGFQFAYVVYNSSIEDEIDFQKITYHTHEITINTKITDVCFPMKIKDKIYVIGFDFYKDYQQSPNHT